MKTKFSRSEILSINNLQITNAANNRSIELDRKVAVPTEEIAAYISNMAMSGNEMAAVQIDEWCRFCRPSSTMEKHILNQIKKAADEIFK